MNKKGVSYIISKAQTRELLKEEVHELVRSTCDYLAEKHGMTPTICQRKQIATSLATLCPRIPKETLIKKLTRRFTYLNARASNEREILDDGAKAPAPNEDIEEFIKKFEVSFDDLMCGDEKDVSQSSDGMCDEN